MKRRILLLCVTAVLLLLSGCAFKPVDELYALPRQSREYYTLQAELDERLNASAQYSAPETGDNRQAVQMADLTGDGMDEVIVFLRTGEEDPLQVCVYTRVGDAYENLTVLSHSGSSFDRVDYVELNGAPGLEIVLGTRVSDQVLQSLHAYTVDDNGAAELLSTNYFKYTLADLDDDGQQDLVTFRSGAEGDQGVAELFRYVDGTIHSAGVARMSVPLEADVIRRIINGRTQPELTAVFVASAYESGLITDVFTVRDGVFTNIAVGPDQTQSAQTLRGAAIYGADIDGDGLIELPSIQTLQKFNQEDPRDYYLVNWYNLDPDGRKIAKLTTYYNDADGWYLIIPDTWEGNLLVRYGDDESGYAGYGFYLYNTELSDARLVATVYMFSGTDARTVAESDGRFVLNQKGDLVFAAKLGNAVDLTELQLQELFRFIQVQWFTGEM